jgi:CRISPR type III-A-associated RAMP protein Csm4
MKPGLVVKLRPAGPWRIGTDSGARNRVDVIYHSDSLYSAVTWAMARLGSLDEWLGATARNSAPAVSFSSCFPFLDEIDFVVPPRTIWPPTSPALMSARVRWKSARFVPLSVVQAMLAGQALDGNQWSLDGASECLVPAGRPGPFRTGVRWSAAVDRLTGAVERHSTACIEFRPGAGLWTIVSFRDEAAHSRWLEPIKAAFRLLADTGFGGERSRGWGRSEPPEFTVGTLPELVLGAGGQDGGRGPGGVPAALAGRGQGVERSAELSLLEAPQEPAPEPPVTEPPPEPEVPIAAESVTALAPMALGLWPLAPDEPPVIEPAPPESEVPIADEPVTEPAPLAPGPWPPAPDEPPVIEPAPPESEVPIAAEPVTEPAPLAPGPDPQERRVPRPTPLPAPVQHWLLSLFTPAPDDSVDWGRGNYAVLARCGRVDSPAGSGELKKEIQMVAEGSVLCAAAPPRGSAADVAPDGFAHPVFRAGFALAIPLPGATEVS